MRKALILAPAVLALAAGCATEEKATPAPVVVTPPAPAVVVPQPAPTAAPTVVVPAPAAVKAGFGRIESIAALPPSAAAGGSAAQRIGVKMEDGTLQYLDTSAPNLAIGDRVEITANGNLRR